MRIIQTLAVLFLSLLVLGLAQTQADAKMNTIRGSGDNDITPNSNRMLPDCGHPKPCSGDLKGTHGADLIYGFGGWDWMNSGPGNDVLIGGPAMDQLYADDGRDVLIGGPGHDHLFGDDGDDYLNAADGADEAMHVEAAYGDRELKGQVGNDVCVLDEDPRDGIAIGSCDKLVIRSVPGLDGETPWGKMQDCVLADTCIEGYVTPGTYFFKSNSDIHPQRV